KSRVRPHRLDGEFRSGFCQVQQHGGGGLLMRIRAGVVGIIVVGTAMLSACQPSNSSPSAIQASGSPGAHRGSPTPTPEPTPPALAVQQVGAVATPSGFTAFAVVENPSGQTATGVNVQITALGPGGQVLTRRSGTIPLIGPGQREAMALLFPVGRTLPSQVWGSVVGVRRSPVPTTAAARVVGARVVPPGRPPSARVR